MKTAIKRVYLITALSLVTVIIHAANAPTFLGDYICHRVDSSNNTVAHPLSVTKTKDTYTFEWDDNSGNPVLYGTGIVHPSLLNVAAASFWDPTKPESVGVEMFELRPDGSLQANWVLQSDNKLGTEDCSRNN